MTFKCQLPSEETPSVKVTHDISIYMMFQKWQSQKDTELISKSEKEKYHMILLIWGIKKKMIQICVFCCLAHGILRWFLSPQGTCHPKKACCAFEKYLNNSTRNCAHCWFYLLGIILCGVKDETLASVSSSRPFLKAGRASRLLRAAVGSQAEHSPPRLQARPLFLAEYGGRQSISWVSICLWQREHQADTSQSGISCFPAFDLLSEPPGHLLGLRCGPCHTGVSSEAHCSIVSEEGVTCQGRVTTPLGLREVCLMRADDNESLIEWLTTFMDSEAFMTPPHWGLGFPAGPRFVTVGPWYCNYKPFL